MKFPVKNYPRGLILRSELASGGHLVEKTLKITNPGNPGTQNCITKGGGEGIVLQNLGFVVSLTPPLVTGPVGGLWLPRGLFTVGRMFGKKKSF